MKKPKPRPDWLNKIASELARRNTGNVDVSVAQTSEVLGHLCDIISEQVGPMESGWFNTALCTFAERLWRHGDRRRAAAKAGKGK